MPQARKSYSILGILCKYATDSLENIPKTGKIEGIVTIRWKMGKKKPQGFQSEHKRQITEKGCKTHVPQRSLRHNLQQVGRGSNLDVHQQMNG